MRWLGFAAFVFVFFCEVARSETWLCKVEESKAVSDAGTFGDSTLSPAIHSSFQEFIVTVGDDPSLGGGPFNLPEQMDWISLQKDVEVNGVTLLGTSKQPVRWRYVLFNLQLYTPGAAKPFFATDGGGWLLYSGLCRQS